MEEKVVQFYNDPIQPAKGLTGNVYAALVGTMLKWSCYVEGDGVKACKSGRQEVTNGDEKLAKSEADRVLKSASDLCTKRVVAALAVT